MENAIILCSGGLDSVVTAHYVKKRLRYVKIIILFFNYGQRNLEAERKFAKKCANNLKTKFKEIKLVELAKISTSMLNSNKKVKEITKKDLKNTKKESSKWYVPFRNGIFLSYAIAMSEAYFIKYKKKFDIFIGFKNDGRESYPDSTKEFIEKINLLQKTRVIAPLIKMDKEDIVLLGKKLGIDFKNTFSCYSLNKIHCGMCLACKLRQEGFYWANVKDPTKYLSQSVNKGT